VDAGLASQSLHLYASFIRAVPLSSVMPILQEDGSWKCKHGDEECAGDLQQLCVQQYSKDYNRYNWLFNFILCNNKEGLDQTGSFATATKCLKVRLQEPR